MAGNGDGDDFWRTANGWMLECAYLRSVQEFSANGRVVEARQLAEAVLKKDFIDLPHIHTQESMIQLMMLLTDGYTYQSPPSGKKTVLEEALVFFQSLLSKFSEDLTFVSSAKRLELDLRIQALYACCGADDFKTAAQAFVRLDLEEKSTYAAAKNSYIAPRDVLRVLNGRKADNPILIQNSYKSFIEEVQEFVKYVHKTFPKPWVLQAYEKRQTSTTVTQSVSPPHEKRSASPEANLQRPCELATSDMETKPLETDVSSSMEDDAELWENLSQITKEQRHDLPNDQQDHLKPASLVIEDSVMETDKQYFEEPTTCIKDQKLEIMKKVLSYFHGMNRPLSLRTQQKIREMQSRERSVLSIPEIHEKARQHLKSMGVLSQLKAHFMCLENKKLNFVSADQRNSPEPLPDSPPESVIENSPVTSASNSPAMTCTSASVNPSLKSAVRTPPCQVVCVPLEEDQSIPLTFRKLATSVPHQVTQQSEDQSSTEAASSSEEKAESQVITKASRIRTRVGNLAGVQKGESPSQPKPIRRSGRRSQLTECVTTATSKRPDTPTVPTPPSRLPNIDAPMSRLRFRQSLVELPSGTAITPSWTKKNVRQKRRAGRGRKGIPWTSSEEEELYAGIVKYGVGNWAMIKSDFKFRTDRTSQDLSDKWRTLQRNERHLEEIKCRWRNSQKRPLGSPQY